MRFSGVALIGLSISAITFDLAKAGFFESIVVTGVITQAPGAGRNTTIDTRGIFAPAGTDLAGSKIQILEQYEPEHFSSGEPCGHSCVAYVAKAASPHLAAAVLISVTVNGVERSFTSAQYSSVILGSTPQDYGANITVYDARGNQNVVALSFSDQVLFKSPFPTQSIVIHSFSFQPTNHTEQEILSFKANSASR